MHKFKDKTLIDEVFAQNFLRDDDLEHKSSAVIKYDLLHGSFLIGKDDLHNFNKGIMYQCTLYKDFPLYIIIPSTETSKINPAVINDTFKKKFEDVKQVLEPVFIQSLYKSLFSSVCKFYFDIALKKMEFAIEDSKVVDFNKLSKNDKSLFGYGMKLRLSINGKFNFNSVIIIPVKLLKVLIYFLSDRDFTKLHNTEAMIKFIERLEFEFMSAKSFFPFKINDFFDELNQNEFRKLVSLLLSSNMISYDMLFALTRVIENGTERVMESLSKRLKEEFIKNTKEKVGTYDKRWVQTANYHILCNLKTLLEKNRFESEYLSSSKEVLQKIDLKITEKIFTRMSFSEWMKKAQKDKKLHSVFSSCSLQNIAIALLSEPKEILDVFRQGISKRSYQDLQSDLDYVRRNTPPQSEQVKAKHEMLLKYAEFSFKDLAQEKKELKHWVGFKDRLSLNYAFNYIGAVNFSLGIMWLDEKGKRSIVKNLMPPAQFFVEDLLTGKIKLNMAYGKNTIQRVAVELAEELYKLSFIGRIKLIKPDSK